MNGETKVRTVVAILAYLLVWVKTMWGVDLSELFTPEVLESIAVLLIAGVSWATSHYKNNDFSEEGCEGTGLTRMLKAQKDDIDGEDFSEVLEDGENDE